MLCIVRRYHRKMIQFTTKDVNEKMEKLVLACFQFSLSKIENLF